MPELRNRSDFCFHANAGEIPEKICNLSQLKMLYLSGNRITGKLLCVVYRGVIGTARH